MSIEKKKILLVEDDTFISDMYRKKLESSGFNVVSSTDGMSALVLAASEYPDLILLDIMLPKMDGWDALDRLKDDPDTKDIPVIIMTNLGSQEDVKRGLEMGAVDYLIKAHFVPSEVVKKISAIIQ
ncbi:MAG: response regulator [bacterium]|nr:response regulator [bacterium]